MTTSRKQSAEHTWPRYVGSVEAPVENAAGSVEAAAVAAAARSKPRPQKLATISSGTKTFVAIQEKNAIGVCENLIGKAFGL